MVLFLELVQGVMHFLSMTCYYILVISYHIGQGIFWLLCQVCIGICDFCSACAIIGDEFYRFMLELEINVTAALRYMRSSTNSGIGAAIEALGLLWKQMGHFLANTQMHSRLLATKCGRWVTTCVSLLQNALLLIADWAWWLLTIIPRFIISCLITLGDCLVFGISSTLSLLSSIVRNIIDDIFRYTIALVVIFMFTKHRSRLLRIVSMIVCKVKQFFIMLLRPVFRLLRLHSTRRSVTAQLSSGWHVTLRIPLPEQRVRLASPPLGSTADKLLESQRCVVCRDQPKCVLLLPCKHLCLCEECANHMVDAMPNSSQCPLCRARIRQSMSVYI